MDHNFTEQIRQWLETPAEQRDYSVGALYLLKLSGNQIMYRNIIQLPEKKADFIEYQVRKYYKFRIQALTHAQVEAMQTKVDEIAKEHFEFKDNNPATDFRKGKRADHDSLPKEIQDIYVENLPILHRMREIHLRLRSLSLDTAPCPDSERYPYLKELIDLDKRLHSNWEQYDNYTPADTAQAVAEPPANPQKSSKKRSKKKNNQK